MNMRRRSIRRRLPWVVKKCVVASNSRRLSEGMETPDFRQVALQHYTTFRVLAEALGRPL
jgi:hypothetical protein